MSYDGSAKPTEYKGIRFRSRLEARWAAMFDVLDLNWEYEPECPVGYMPDFLLHGVDDRRVFVEVKPVEIYRANRAQIVSKALESLTKIGSDEFLVITDEFRDCSDFDTLIFGYMPVDERDLGDPYEFDEEVVLFRPGINYGSEYDFAHTMGSWAGRLTGAYDGNALFEGTMLGKQDVLGLWTRAGNAIQWKPQ